MLAYCLSDGLTCGGAVYRRGEIFVLSSTMEAEFGGLTDSQLATKQRQVYGKELFRLPISEEIISAYQSGKLPEELCNKKELHAIAAWKESDSARKFEASRTLRETLESESPELKEEEEKTAFESVGAETEFISEVVEEELEEDKPVVKTTSKKGTRRTTSKKKK